MKEMTLGRGLYAITDSDLIPRSRLESAMRQVLEGGAQTIQYREKKASGSRQLEEALLIRGLCREYDATFIVNDDVDLALKSKADGIHIGHADGCCRDIRNRVGGDFLIGVSCYNSLERGLIAQTETADYVAFGSAYPSVTKPDAVHAPMSLYHDAVATLEIPIVAIGGINSSNAGILIKAGCTAVAVISGLFDAPDIELEALAFGRLFGQDARQASNISKTAIEDTL
ncbi:MAG: thiamine phosphate synthase [Gammaproteobacteria bacterium]